MRSFGDAQRRAQAQEDEEAFSAAVQKAAPYLFRIGRALTYAFVAYVLLQLQSNFDFSYIAFALAIFFLSLIRRALIISEVALLLLTVSLFITDGFLKALEGLF
ncbi:hypothetical protein DC522_23965 [Microvirga sp. KLBC 81]|uniref:hypothetical protein n=1 Tax=Microvirga sp. KLBC 81 TaxID=1862707 RepID=UPI000D5090D9|nr:hypothetical protein [Microvirga sp. KLBC 81]PVE21923.1 hypothetical protein DC522_23965 [Microvirga sp. KLBC 81]